MQVCVVLAGGLGTRLRSVLADRPKCLAPVGAQPFLLLLMRHLAAAGVGRFVLSLGHLAPQVLDAVRGFDLGVPVQAVVEPHALGTGGGLLLSMAQRGLVECLVTNGDTWLDAPLAPLLPPLDLAGGERCRLAALAVADRSRFGGLALSGAVVTGFEPAGAAGPGLVNAGFYRLHRSAFDGFTPGAALSLEHQVLMPLARAGGVRAARVDGRFIDIGVPDDYRRFCDAFG